MWTCPQCSKTFAKAHQSHQCINLPPEALFSGKAPELWPIFELLIEKIEAFAPHTVTGSRKSISLYASNHKVFIVLQPKKKWIDIYFWLGREETEFPIFKVVQMSKTKWSHFVRIDSPDDIDRQLLGWIAEGHQFILSR